MKPIRPLVVGLAACAVAVAMSIGLGRLVPAVSPLTWCVILGVIVGNTGLLRPQMEPGLAFASKKLLRAGIVLMGLRLAVGDVLALGWKTLVLVIVLVVATFFGTQALGRLLGVSPGQGLLIATGFSICGASAVAAMDGVTHNERKDVVTAITLVTLFGSLAIVVLPLLRVPLGFSPEQFGMWAGASVHDVAQTVATASTAGAVALSIAVVVKLTRVALLAPMVIGASLWQRRVSRGAVSVDERLPPLLPAFVGGFLVMIALRSTGRVPEPVIAWAHTIETMLLAAALFGLGCAVHLRTLVRTGGKGVLLGLISWVLIATLAAAGVVLISG